MFDYIASKASKLSYRTQHIVSYMIIFSMLITGIIVWQLGWLCASVIMIDLYLLYRVREIKKSMASSTSIPMRDIYDKLYEGSNNYDNNQAHKQGFGKVSQRIDIGVQDKRDNSN
ncbi:MAG: hypothetical protein WB588_05440 [Dehalococcoidia bacterium]